jgi:cytoskeleton protein RodZ
VFARGHLRKYAQLLDLDEAALLEAYAGEAAPAEPVPAPAVRSRERFAVDDGLNWPVVLVVLLVVGVAAFAVWRLWDQPGEPVPVTTELSQVWAGGETLALVEPAVTPRGPLPPPPTTGVAAASAPSAATPLAQGAPAGDGPLLAISYTGECWTEVSDAAGTRLFFGMARAGQRVAVRGEAPFSVVLGNAAAATLSLAGEPWPIPDAQVVNNVARLRIDSRDF